MEARHVFPATKPLKFLIRGDYSVTKLWFGVCIYYERFDVLL